MEVTINTISEVRQEADIRLSHEDLQPRFDKAYRKFQPKAELRGFRKGKVPLEIVKRIYGEAIEHDALDEVVDDVYREAMDARQIRPLGTPSMIDMDFKRGEHFHFKIQYDVKPAISLGQYKGIKVEKVLRDLPEEEIDARIHLVRQSHGTTTVVESVSDEEHTVIADVEELDESGVPLVGKRTQDARFYLADPLLVKEIKDSLANAVVGETYRATFESRRGDNVQTMHLAVHVKKIEKLNLPALDAEFIQKVTSNKMSTPEELRSFIREDLERRNRDQSEREVDDAIAHELVKLHDFPVPESVVNSFLDAFVDDLRSKSRDRKLPRDFDEGAFRENNREHAVWQAKWMLLKERIAEVENIAVTDAELERLAEAESGRVGVEKARLLAYYKTSSSTSDHLLTDKLMSFLRSHAKITEKVVKEPNKS